MTLGIDARLINGNRRGMGNVLYHTLKHFKNYYQEKVYLFFDKDVENELQIELEKLGYEILVINNKNYILWEQIVLRFRLPKDIKKVWFPFNTGTVLLGKQKILTLHDVMFMKSKDILPYSKSMYQLLGRFYRKLIAPIIARESEQVVTISGAAKEDIISEIPKLDTGKIQVVYNGCNKSINDLRMNDWKIFKDKSGVADEFFFCLGALDPRKNTLYTIDAFYTFTKKHSLDHLQLVIGGISNWKESIFFNRVKELQIEDQVLFLDFLPQEYLDLLYYNAKLFLFLTYYEGFGLPILESMAFGTPVVTTNVTSMPEIAGNAAVKTSHDNLEVTVQDIEDIYFNKKIYNDFVEKGKERVKAFTWENTAKQMAELIIK
ncbi:group 1 glycosyl transferase [Neobacillus bataviensis LMG 21833]|uniref:Group 1 glycosyl transferase n=1 Tax=Neobacillus bataviensis LMG 21833 TaxID=1117379 RepID=K6DZY0_9BACI|nr:glycosyltransferase family 1 protein [Neobacillus bataviensis]EKN66456.1 group 1 glycosyl transferase [Neobacillus bataviensis LMG 21833]